MKDTKSISRLSAGIGLLAIVSLSVTAVAQDASDETMDDLLDSIQSLEQSVDENNPTEDAIEALDDVFDDDVDDFGTDPFGLFGIDNSIDDGLFDDEDTGPDLPRVAPIYAPGFDMDEFIAAQTEKDGNDSAGLEVDTPADARPSEDELLEDSEVFDAGQAEQDLELLDQPAVLLRGLDKITGRSTDLTVKTSDSVVFGGLRVTVRACHQTPPTEAPVSIAYLEVEDFGFGLAPEDILERDIDQEKRVFFGWMYASSPGIHALEHPVYDVWVIRCMAEVPGEDDVVDAEL